MCDQLKCNPLQMTQAIGAAIDALTQFEWFCDKNHPCDKMPEDIRPMLNRVIKQNTSEQSSNGDQPKPGFRGLLEEFDAQMAVANAIARFTPYRTKTVFDVIRETKSVELTLEVLSIAIEENIPPIEAYLAFRK